MTFLRRAPRLHDTTHSPVALWQFAGDFTDSSGNGLTLTEVGTVPFAKMEGLQGATFNHNTGNYLRQGVVSAGAASLQITGDLTIEMLISWAGDPPGTGSNNDKDLLSHTNGSGETEADNYLYHIGTNANVGGLQYFAEEGAGINISYSITDDTPPAPELLHFAMTRSSNQIQFYVNGETLGAPSVGLNAPTGGTSGNLYIGADFGGANPGVVFISSFKIINSALTAAQVLAEYRRTLGA